MPVAVRRFCGQPGCRELVDRGRCEKHRLAAHAADRQYRGKTAERGYGGRHVKWRRLVLARDPLCVNPYKIPNHYVPSTVADHIVPLNPDGSGDWSLENGQGLCAVPCHARKTRDDRTHGACGPGRRANGTEH